MARLDDVKADASAPGEVFRLLTDAEDPKTLAEVAKAWAVPKGRFVEWFTTTHADLYDAALKVRAADMALEALAISDEQAEVVKENGETYDPDVGRDKLRIDTRLKLASKFDRMRYGETVRVERSVMIGIDAGLLGKASELLRLVSSGRPMRVIEGESSPAAEAPPPADVAPARLPLAGDLLI